MRVLFFLPFLFAFISVNAQNKKPLDHSVYDSWKGISERAISNDGKYIVYTINPQEGDGSLVIQTATGYKKVIDRGYSPVITNDSRYVVFKIKPVFQETRQAKIKKKKADEMAKDTLAIVELGKEEIVRIPRVKSFKTPEKGSDWIAYQMEKPLPDTTKKSKGGTDSLKIKTDLLVKLADSVLRRSIDSVKGKISRETLLEVVQRAANEILTKKDDINATPDLVLTDAEGDDAPGGGASDGTDLIVRNTNDNKEKTFKLVSEFYFDKKGTRLAIETSKNSKDSNSKGALIVYNLQNGKIDTVMKKLNDGKNFSFDESKKNKYTDSTGW